MIAALTFVLLAALGTLVRALAGTLRPGVRGRAAGTLAVNLVGAFALGLLVGADVDTVVVTVLGVGGLGALTTFSTMLLDTVDLSVPDHRWWGAAYLGATVVGAVSLAELGLRVGA